MTASLVRFVSAVGKLVAPLLHLDALPVVAGELALLIAPGQLQGRLVGLCGVAKGVTTHLPQVGSEGIRTLRSICDSCDFTHTGCQRPLVTFSFCFKLCVAIALPEDDAGVGGELLQGERGVDKLLLQQRQAETSEFDNWRFVKLANTTHWILLLARRLRRKPV